MEFKILWDGIKFAIALNPTQVSDFESFCESYPADYPEHGMDEHTSGVKLEGVDSGVKIEGNHAVNRGFGFGDFDLIKVIGRGSYAKVLLVRLKQTNRLYAMKVIKKELVCDEEDIDWVQTEKHVFETASNHPFLVGLHSCFQSVSFAVLKFLKCFSLELYIIFTTISWIFDKRTRKTAG